MKIHIFVHKSFESVASLCLSRRELMLILDFDSRNALKMVTYEMERLGNLSSSYM